MTTGPVLSYESKVNPTFTVLRPRAYMAMACVGFVLLIMAAEVVGDFMQIQLLNRMAAGEAVPRPEALSNDLRQQLIALAYMGALLLSGIMLWMWLYRANRNLRAISAEKPTFTPGAAVWWWFVPFLNLVRPYQIVREIWQLTLEDESGSKPEATLVGCWWGFWICGNVLARVGMSLLQGAKTPQDFIGATWADMIDLPLMFIAGLLLLVIIHRVTEAQERKGHVMPPMAA